MDKKMKLDIKKVLICDDVDEACAELLRKNGIEAVKKLKLTEKELIQEVKNYDALVVRSETKVTDEILTAGAGSLKAVGRAGAGVDNIDVPAATKRDIAVLNTPGANSISACELSCILIGALARPIVQAGHSMREGRWDRKLYLGTELKGKTLGILGLGRIGREVAVRMKAWGMKVIGFDPITTELECNNMGIEKVELEGIWERADYITVHTPLMNSTRDLICEETLNKCKDGVKIVNVARGGIVDEEDVLFALESGKCGGAALDVFSEEPPKASYLKKLLHHPKVIATPHLGASTAEAQIRCAVEVAEQFIALTGNSTQYKTYHGLINRDVLKYHQ